MKDATINTNIFTNPFNVATVVSNNDPENAYRVKVRIDVIHDNISDDQLPWAARVGPTFLGFGSSDIDHAIPEVGTKVLTIFVANDPNSILYLGCLYAKNQNAPSGDNYLNSYGIYTRNGEFVGVEKISGLFHMIWNGDLKFDVKGKIKIGSNASEPAVLGTKLETLLNTMISTFNSHTHTGNLGIPTSSPSSQMQYKDVTSQKVTVE